MIEWHAMISLTRIDRAEAGVMAATFLGVILHDLTAGILIGMAPDGGCALFISADVAARGPVPMPP